MIERRSAQVSVKGRKLEGFAARFNAETQINNFREVIKPAAFASSLATGRDILCLADHDTTRVLGRTKSGTLELSEDADGLRFSLDVPDTQIGRDLLALAERRDLGGMSFGFRVIEDHWTGDLRELRQVELLEVSIVQAWPAYEQTSVEARSLRPISLEYLWMQTLC